jgi:hypothetical protein
LRAVDTQAKRLRAIEAAQPKNEPAEPHKEMAPALPAPVDIIPVPQPLRTGPPTGSVGPQN